MYHPKQKPSKIKEVSSSQLAVVCYNFFLLSILLGIFKVKIFQVEQVFLWEKRFIRTGEQLHGHTFLSMKDKIFQELQVSRLIFVFKTKEKGDWYQNRKLLFDLVLLGYEEYFETLLQKGWIKSRWMQLPCRSVDYHGLSMSLLQLGSSILQVNLNWPASLHSWEAHEQPWSTCVSESLLICSCVHKCQRRKLLSGAAYGNVQLSVVPWWTGLNSRCAEAPLTLGFVLSVKHSEISVTKTVPVPFPWHSWMTPVEHSPSLTYSQALFKNFVLQCLLSELAFSCTTLKHQSLWEPRADFFPRQNDGIQTCLS